LTYADQAKLKKEGRSFDCSTCKVSHLRRCKEDKWDFTENDAPFFPMYVNQGGELYGFCPAKATWDSWTVTMYKALLCSATTGSQWVSGGISEQPEWWIDLLSWFVTRYDMSNFTRKATMVLGDGESKTPQGVRANGTKQRPANRSGRT
jgi:hypothetical protein